MLPSVSAQKLDRGGTSVSEPLSGW
jgi:hypothetical protein